LSASLTVPVRWFVDDVSAALHELAGTTDDKDDGPRRDAATEAFNLTCGFIDADGLHTDDELWALTAAFGPLLPTQLGAATPADVRKAGLVANAKTHVASVTPMFELLVQADVKHHTRRSHDYYRAALELGFAVAAVDNHTSTTELSVIGDFQRMLLETMSSAGLRKPGEPEEEPQPNPKPKLTATAGAAAESKPEAPELPPARSIEDLMAELDGLVGLEAVKREVRLTTDLTRVEQLRRQRGLPVLEHSRHVVFTGNPGTGKTTVARLLAQIYRTLGVVTKGHLVETDRSQLVAGYVGQTAIQVRKVFDEADEGILLIDEAYALARGGENDFGKEAIDTIVKLVEDRRDSVIVIVAGYPEEMADFVNANPGLRSRFPKTIHFPDYSTDELLKIFESLGRGQKYTCEPEALEKVRTWLDAQPRVRGFGNGRLARNLFESIVARQSSRLVALDEPTDDQLCTFVAADVPNLDES
jgi:SpoVK/Ycf46/Vps4 family AAA+-type ATPase